MEQNQTLVDVIEAALEVPFEARYLENLDFSNIQKLAFKVQNFYEAFKLPEKPTGELRPYLYPRYSSTDGVSSDYHAHQSHFKGGVFSFDATAVKPIASQLKSYLLYCHGLCIHDSLPYLLDFFRLATDKADEHAVRRIAAVIHLLKEYASVAQLLRRKIIIPVSDEIFNYRNDNMFFLSDEEKREIDLAVGAPEADLGRYLGTIVKKQFWQQLYTQERLDLYFPEKTLVSVFQGLLRAAQKRFSSNTVVEPFNAGIIGSATNIDPTKISMEDIIRVREEEVFNDFRMVLRSAFERVHNVDGRFTDFEAEFAASIRQEMEENKEKIRAMTTKSSLLSQLFLNSDRILFGAGIGSFPGMAMGSLQGAIFGAAAGAARPVYDVARQIIASSSNPTRTSLRNHFLAIDSKSSSS